MFISNYNMLQPAGLCEPRGRPQNQGRPLEEEYEGAQTALQNCLTAAVQADPALAGGLGSTTALMTVAAAGYQV